MNRERVELATAFLRERLTSPPAVGIVLGSGLAPLADRLDEVADVATEDIPGYPPSTVVGHAGRFLFGELGGQPVAMLKGRLHAYEGYDLDEVVLPVRIMAGLGVSTLVLTNAAGGIHPDFRTGDVMLIADHLNLHHASPLRGRNVDEWGPRFPDMTEIYDADLRRTTHSIADESGMTLREGIYASVPGPQYETPAEIRMLATLGADAVGMSTVPEAIAARHLGLRVLGLSVISNAAAGISKTPLDHAEVVEAGKRVGEELSSLLVTLLARLGDLS